ncbi:hypothetical protein QLH52_17220 [Methylomonas sp. OY6]|uniref:Uncharacterized protein n=1 Tax=Methylomonas defluvii TaxID=3045149 RepID=A0ABU4UIY0_9GAMM|nr:hypothetical protein [Methylomonas sp. OY6]MDX8129043.1 hypothetical protein [Methylomonas sp. OY6]
MAGACPRTRSVFYRTQSSAIATACNDESQAALTNTGGMVIGDAGVYNRDSSSIYRHTFSPSQLLGICSEGRKAAFTEQLGILALATDGSYQLYYLDASALAAFALEPA